MKRKLLLLPMFMLVLAACGTSSSETPSVSEPISEVPVTSEEPVSEDPITSEDPVTSEVPVTSEEPVTSDDVPPPPPSTSEEIPDEMTISQIRDIPLNSSGGLEPGQIKKVRTSGIVTTVARRASGPAYNVTIQDGNEAMLLYAIAEDKIAEFGQPGDELVVDGLLAPYKGLWELSAVKVVSKTEGTAVTPKALTSVAQDDLVGLDSVLVTIENLQVVVADVVADDNADNLTFKLGEDSIGAYLHYAIPEDVQAEIAAALVPEGDVDGKIDAMDTLTFTGVVDMNEGTYQLAITGPENFTNVTDGGEVTNVEYSSLIDIRAGIKDESITAGEVVNFEAVVTSKDNFDEGYGNGEVTLQSTEGTETAGMFVYRLPTAIYETIEVGNLVRGTAAVGAYQGLDQLVAPFVNWEVVEADGPAQTFVELTDTLIASTDFADMTGTMVTATGLTATADVTATVGTDLTLTLGKGTETVDLFANKYFADHEAVIAKLNLVKTGYTVELEEGAAYLGWRVTERVMLLDSTKIIVRDELGEIVTEGEEPVVEGTVLDVDTLALDGVAYDDSNFTGATAKVYNGINYGLLGVGDYGDGFQWRQSSASSIWNETAFPEAIASITINYNNTKNFPGQLDLFTSVGTALTASQTEGGTSIGDAATLYTVTTEFTALDDVHFFRVQYPLSGYTYSAYVSSIVITFHEAV